MKSHMGFRQSYVLSVFMVSFVFLMLGYSIGTPGGNLQCRASLAELDYASLLREISNVHPWFDMDQFEKFEWEKVTPDTGEPTYRGRATGPYGLVHVFVPVKSANAEFNLSFPEMAAWETLVPIIAGMASKSKSSQENTVGYSTTQPIIGPFYPGDIQSGRVQRLISRIIF